MCVCVCLKVFYIHTRHGLQTLQTPNSTIQFHNSIIHSTSYVIRRHTVQMILRQVEQTNYRLVTGHWGRSELVSESQDRIHLAWKKHASSSHKKKKSARTTTDCSLFQNASWISSFWFWVHFGNFGTSLRFAYLNHYPVSEKTMPISYSIGMPRLKGLPPTLHLNQNVTWNKTELSHW